jgi:hypothetical protein
MTSYTCLSTFCFLLFYCTVPLGFMYEFMQEALLNDLQQKTKKKKRLLNPWGLTYFLCTHDT